MKRQSILEAKVFLITISPSIFSIVFLMFPLLTIPNTSKAAIINGSFETGDLTGWESIGNVSIVDSSFGSNPPDGNYQVFLSTGEGAVSGTELEAFLGFHHEYFDNIGAASAIKQTFMVEPNPMLTDFEFVVTSLVNTIGTGAFAVFLDQTEDIQENNGSGHYISGHGASDSIYYNSSTVFDWEAQSSLIYVPDRWVITPLSWLEPGKEHTVAFVLPDRFWPHHVLDEKGLLVDSVRIVEGDSPYIIPVPSAVILCSLGLTFSGWMLKRKRMM